MNTAQIYQILATLIEILKELKKINEKLEHPPVVINYTGPPVTADKVQEIVEKITRDGITGKEHHV
jgi:hypothetical protein